MCGGAPHIYFVGWFLIYPHCMHISAGVTDDFGNVTGLRGRR